MNLVEIGRGGVDWTCLAQDRYSWRDFWTAVMNSGLLKILENYREATALATTALAATALPSGYGTSSYGTGGYGTSGLSSSAQLH
jgi:hypothetical protein